MRKDSTSVLPLERIIAPLDRIIHTNRSLMRINKRAGIAGVRRARRDVLIKMRISVLRSSRTIGGRSSKNLK